MMAWYAIVDRTRKPAAIFVVIAMSYSHRLAILKTIIILSLSHLFISFFPMSSSSSTPLLPSSGLYLMMLKYIITQSTSPAHSLPLTATSISCISAAVHPLAHQRSSSTWKQPSQ